MARSVIDQRWLPPRTPRYDGGAADQNPPNHAGAIGEPWRNWTSKASQPVVRTSPLTGSWRTLSDNTSAAPDQPVAGDHLCQTSPEVCDGVDDSGRHALIQPDSHTDGKRYRQGSKYGSSRDHQLGQAATAVNAAGRQPLIKPPGTVGRWIRRTVASPSRSPNPMSTGPGNRSRAARTPVPGEGGGHDGEPPPDQHVLGE